MSGPEAPGQALFWPNRLPSWECCPSSLLPALSMEGTPGPLSPSSLSSSLICVSTPWSPLSLPCCHPPGKHPWGFPSPCATWFLQHPEQTPLGLYLLSLFDLSRRGSESTKQSPSLGPTFSADLPESHLYRVTLSPPGVSLHAWAHLGSQPQASSTPRQWGTFGKSQSQAEPSYSQDPVGFSGAGSLRALI